MPKYYIKIAYHNGAIMGRCPSYDYIRDTPDQVNELILSIKNTPNTYIEYVQVILGEEIEVKWKTEEQMIKTTEKTFIGIE